MTTSTATPDLEPDLSGCVLDRYRLVRCLGVGGMGAVYEAEHTTLGKRVAVKLLRQQIATQDIARRRFLQEAKAATRVEHPHVVDISDFGQTADGRVYFVMELLAGRDLGDLLVAEGRLAWPRAQELLGQLVSALAAAHAHGVVHRDMKPSNCFLVDVPGMGGRDFVKVLDFGIAKVAASPGEDTQGLTSTDEVLGSVGYMAPEMAMGMGDDPRSDVYAVGVMMYRMLVGELPFQGGTAFQVLARHVSEPPISPRTRVPSIPAGVERIILTALAKHPEDRFASMQALGEAIRRGDVHEAEPQAHATMRMDAASSRSHPPTEKTALLGVAAIDTGPRPALGGVPILVEGDPSGSRRLAPALPSELQRLSRTAPRPVVRHEPVDDEPEPDEPEPDEPETDEPEDPRDAPVGRGRVALVAAIVLGMTSVLAVVALALSPGAHPQSERATVVPARHEPHEQPAPPVEPGPRPPVVAPAEPPPAEPPPLLEPPPAEPPPAEPPPAEPPPLLEPPATSPSPERRPRTDAEIVARVVQKLRARCRVDGRTQVKVEGIIAASGTVVSPLASPPQGPGRCAREVVKQARFARGKAMRSMPVISVAL